MSEGLVQSSSQMAHAPSDPVQGKEAAEEEEVVDLQALASSDRRPQHSHQHHHHHQEQEKPTKRKHATTTRETKAKSKTPRAMLTLNPMDELSTSNKQQSNDKNKKNNQEGAADLLAMAQELKRLALQPKLQNKSKAKNPGHSRTPTMNQTKQFGNNRTRPKTFKAAARATIITTTSNNHNSSSSNGISKACPIARSRHEVEQKLHTGEYLCGKLRPNAHMPSEAYLTIEGLQVDVLVRGVADRGNALNGDQVAVELCDKSLWLRLPKDRCQVPEAPPAQQMPSNSNLREKPDAALTTLEAIWRPHHFEVFSVVKPQKKTSKKRQTKDQAKQMEPKTAESCCQEVLEMLRDTIQRECKRPTARVVWVLQAANPKGIFVGRLVAPPKQPLGNKKKLTANCESKIKTKSAAQGSLSLEHSFVVFQARESTQQLCIPCHQLPDEFLKNPELYASKMLCMCQMLPNQSDDTSSEDAMVKLPFPEGKFIKTIGQFDEIEPGVQAALNENGLERHALEFDRRILRDLHHRFGAQGEKFQLSKLVQQQTQDPSASQSLDLTGRRDFRKEHRVNIFSIDPATARDLDDALHIRPIDEDVFEIGVHIADVSHFVLENSLLDQEAQRRATSVYFANGVLPMLPRLLCEKLCSLEPDEDRLAFSLTWRMHRDGSLVKGSMPWFGKSIIRSCCKLDYGTAQRMIDGSVVRSDGTLNWEEARRPSGPASRCGEIIQNVKDLWQVASARRRQRFESGALALDNVKLCFTLDSHGNPTSFRDYELRDSNRLVEEYMLLANYLVAQQLLLTQGPFAFLRRHPQPLGNAMSKTVAFLQEQGFDLDASDSKTLHASLQAILQSYGKDVFAVIQHLLTKPMQPAEYFVVNNQAPEQWRHYALSIPYYTHFTSPIRRYADVVVHRLLQESLVESEELKKHLSPERQQKILEKMHSIATNCNLKKMTAKNAESQVDRVFLNVLLKRKPMCLDGLVVDFGGKQIAVYFPTIDLEKRFFAREWPHRGAEWNWNARTKQLLVNYIPKASSRVKRNPIKEEEAEQQEDHQENPPRTRRKVALSRQMQMDVTFLKRLRFKVSARREFPLDLQFKWLGEEEEEEEEDKKKQPQPNGAAN